MPPTRERVSEFTRRQSTQHIRQTTYPDVARTMMSSIVHFERRVTISKPANREWGEVYGGLLLGSLDSHFQCRRALIITFWHQEAQLVPYGARSC